MAYLIGTDEAGYGPNLGPLTVTGTLWQVPDTCVDFNTSIDLYQVLSESVAAKPGRARSNPSDNRLHLADSKAVYKPKSKFGLGTLEHPVLALLHCLHQRTPTDDRDLFRLLVSECVEDRLAKFTGEAGLWSPREPFPLPLAADVNHVRTSSTAFSADCDRNHVRLLKVLCQPVFPAAFNHAVDRLGNKASVLSATTLQIVRKLLDETNGEPSDGNVLVGCDKHGGRSKYGPLLQQWVTDQWINIDQELPESSCYHWEEPAGHTKRNVAISFTAKGESFLPAAVASMFSKYVREIYMELWNEFWIELQPDLKPTKGYPVDAKRFMADIQPVRQQASLADRTLWRQR